MKRRGHGEGSVFPRKDGSWVALIDLGWKDGKRQRKAFHAKTRPEAHRKLRAALNAREHGTLSAGRTPTVAQFLERWLGEVRVAPRTLESYVSRVRRHIIPALGTIRLPHLRVQDVNAMLRGRESVLSPRSVAHLRAVLRGALTDAEREGLVIRNVARLAEPPKVTPYEAKYLSVEDGKRFLQAAKGERLEALFTCALLTALRPGELLGLGWEDVDLEAGVLHIRHSAKRLVGKGVVVGDTKTHRSKRPLPLVGMAAEALTAHRLRQAQERWAAGTDWKDLGLVFCSERGTPLDTTNVGHRDFRRVCDRAGIPYRTGERPGLRLYDLRHSTATILSALGTPLPVIQRILGHSSITTTMIYAHVPDELVVEAAKRLDRALAL